MSATITVSALSLASDGKTLTGTLSGGTGAGYGPATGVTGLTLKATVGGFAYAWAQSSATVSGSTLTVALAAPVPSGAAVTLDVSASSNLTDSGADTAQGQTGTAVTNGSTAPGATTGFGAVSKSLVTSTVAPVSGGASDPGGHGGRSTVAVSYDGEVNTTFVGTDLLLACNFFSSATLDVTATPSGGGTPVTATVVLAGLSSQTAWYQYPMLSGLARGPWDVQIKIRGSVANFWMDQSNSLLAVDATGGTPSLQAPPSATVGAQYVVNSYLPNVVTDGDVWTASGQSSPTVTHNNARVRFRAKCTGFKLWSFLGSTNKVLLYVDGALSSVAVAASPSAPASHNNGFWTVAAGLDGTAYHTYEMENVANGSALYAHTLNLQGAGAALDTSASLTSKAPACYLGDSITYGSFPPRTADQGYVHYCALALSQAAANRGVTGNKVADVLARLTDVTGLSPAPQKVWVLVGANDAGGAGNSLTPTATFQGSYQTLVQNLCDALPSVPIYFGSILKGDAPVNANRAAYNACIAAAFASATAGGARANAHLIASTDSWYDGSSGLHPDAAGCQSIGTALALVLSPPSAAAPNAFLPAHLRAPRGRTRVGPGVKTH